MTPARQPQQLIGNWKDEHPTAKMFVIYDFEWGHCEDCAKDCSEFETHLDKTIKNREVTRVTHTSAPAPECDCDCLSCNPDMYISCERRINPDRPRYTVEQIADIDKQIRKAAKAARERDIEALDSLCSTRESRYEDPSEPEDRREFLRGMSAAAQMARSLIQSLRSQKEPQQ